MSFHGGLLGVLCAFWYFARTRKKSFLEVSDFIAPLVPQGLFWGRMGNFINGELWGKVSDVPGPWSSPPAGPGRATPRSSMKACWKLVLFVVLWIFSARPRKAGAVSGLFALLYAVFRFGVEFVRVPDAQLATWPLAG